MRVTLHRRTSTKTERIFAEILKRNHIPFDYSVSIHGREIDFIVDNYAIEIDGHLQDPIKNKSLIDEGFIPIHYTTHALRHNRYQVELDIINKHGIFSSSSRRSRNREPV